MYGVPQQQHQRDFLDDIFKAPEEGFKEYLPVDEFFDDYLKDLAEGEPDGAGPGQNKGARRPAEYLNGGAEETKVAVPGADPEAKPKRKRNRNERQQMLNKLAQLRYRERKRQKAQELAGAVDNLSQQVTEQAKLESKTKQLAEQNRYLEDALQQKEAEVQQAKQQQQQTASGSEGSSGVSTKQRSEASKKEELGELVQRWLDTVEELRQLLALVGLDQAGPNFGGLLKSVEDFSSFSPHQQRILHNIVDKIDMHVDTVMQLCMAVLRLSGADIEAIMNANFDRCRNLLGWKEEEKWINTAQELSFSLQQREKILHARQDMLAKLQRIYTERHRLNAQAVSMLLPSVHSTAAEQAPGELPEGERKELTQVLEALEENLKAEQRAVCEQEYITFKHLLTPFQGGLFVVKAFPDHCDCLALVNAVHQLYGDLEVVVQR
ncbi:hypothetical protein WJX72_007075 [[Myrmecia] bisecta]|uniref:BZIP domain-containing protein n=1 Tax=[Myrmecia] bisecta TaxID=41462 RepID=A0AAW1PQG7_9CHLO